MTNLHEIMDRVRNARQRLPANEAAVLFAAAVRLAAAQGATLRARLVQLDESGGLHLAPFDDQAPEIEPGYLAPELLSGEAPKKSEPRVQVYAAGALGYELLTGHLPPGNPAELSGPLGDIVRMALAADRRERFGDLSQLNDAIEGVQPRPPAEGERNIFSALRTRWTRAPLEKEAVARIIEKLGQLETQVAQLTKAQARLDAGQRDSLERLERFEDGQQRLSRPAPSVLGPALLAALLAAAAVVGAGWMLGLVPPRQQQVREQPPVPAPVAPPPQAAPPLPVPDAAVAEVDAGAPDASVAEDPTLPLDAGAAAIADAGAPDAAVPEKAAEAAAAAPAPSPAPVKRKPRAEVSQAALLHAVAISQVRRGESALEQTRVDEALASFRAALDNEANLAVAYRGLGMAYSMQGNDAEALQAYEKYLQLAPSAKDAGDIRKSIAELKSRAK